MQLRVMTYNVRYFGHVAAIAGLGSTRQGIASITAAIARLDHLPHVICLQEVELRSWRSRWSHTPSHIQETQIEAVMKTLDWALHEQRRHHRYGALYFPAHQYRMGKAALYTTGLAVLVRDDLRVLSSNADAPEDITHRRWAATAKMKQSRICAHVRLQSPAGLQLDIFNTHLSLPAFISRHVAQIPSKMGWGENQAREVSALAEFVRSRRATDRFLIAGDFNSLPGSPVYERILSELDVHDPFPEALGSPAQLHDYPTAGFLRFRMRLDHIFVGPGLRWLDFEDTHPFGADDGQWHGLSDHVPIIGRFDLVR